MSLPVYRLQNYLRGLDFLLRWRRTGDHPSSHSQNGMVMKQNRVEAVMSPAE